MAFGVAVTAVRRDAAGRAVGITGRDRHGAPSRPSTPASSSGPTASGPGWPGPWGHRSSSSAPPSGSTHYAYIAGLDGGGIEFHLAEGAMAGVFPTHGGEACVWVCTTARAGRGRPPRRRVAGRGLRRPRGPDRPDAGRPAAGRAPHLPGPLGRPAPQPGPGRLRPRLGPRRRRRLPPRPDHRARHQRRLPRRRPAGHRARRGPAGRGAARGGAGRLRPGAGRRPPRDLRRDVRPRRLPARGRVRGPDAPPEHRHRGRSRGPGRPPRP